MVAPAVAVGWWCLRRPGCSGRAVGWACGRVGLPRRRARRVRAQLQHRSLADLRVQVFVPVQLVRHCSELRTDGRTGGRPSLLLVRLHLGRQRRVYTPNAASKGAGARRRAAPGRRRRLGLHAPPGRRSAAARAAARGRRPRRWQRAAVSSGARERRGRLPETLSRKSDSIN